ncbi:VWFA domain-containing protein [Entamoeba marina]
MLFYGEVITKDNINDLVESVHFDIETTGIHAKVKATHSINNKTEKPIDAVISLKFDDECTVCNYVIRKKDSVIESQLKAKEEAKQQHKDASASGYSSSVVEKTDDNTFSLKIGLLPPNELIDFEITYLTKLQYMENELVLTLPSPTSQKNLPFSIKISGKSPFTFKGVLTEEMEVTVPNDVEGIYVMNDEDLGEANGMVTFINKEKEGEINVVFVCDRSGSMYGSGIKALKETLQLFLRQLPENSKFNIISFGDKFDGLYKESKKYNDESLDFASKCVKKFDANYGGTDIFKPLKSVLKNNCQVILLTDGQVYGEEKTQILELLKKSCITSICHAIGLGDSVDEQLIRDIARVGGGISSISKNPADLRGAVSRITQRILRPSISNASISSSNKISFEPKTIGKFTSDTTVYFTLNENQVKDVNEMKTTLKGDVNGKEIVYTASIKEVTNGMLIGQLDGARQLKLAEAINDKEKAIKLSLKYNILSRFTAFIAVDTSKKLPIDDIKTIKLTEISFYEEAKRASGIGYGSSGSSDYSDSYEDSDSNDEENFRALPKKTMATQPKPTMKLQREKAVECSAPKCKKKSSGGIFNFVGGLFASNKTSAPPKSSKISSGKKKVSVTNSISVKEECEEINECMDGLDNEILCDKLMEEEKEVMVDERKKVKKENKQKKEILPQGLSYDNLIELQRADGHFINVQSVFNKYNEIKEKYKDIDENIFNTIVAICLLRSHFKAKKVEWDLMVKKAMGYLKKNSINDDFIDEVMKLV